MAILPLGPANAFLKLFGKERQDGGSKTDSQQSGVTAQQDVVNISEAAQQRLDGIRTLSSDAPEEINAVTGETRQILEETGLSLGLEGNFA